MKLIEKFKKQPTIIKILDLIFILVFAYAAITMKVLEVSPILLILLAVIPFAQWILKKEKD